MQPPIFAILAWVPVTAILFRLIGPKWAALISVMGGYLFLPSQRFSLGSDITAHQYLWRGNATGLGLLLGLLLFDRPSIAKIRPRWPDMAMVAFAAYPLIGLVTGGRSALTDVMEMLGQRSLGWVVPYAAGRLYFGGEEGAKEVAASAVIATLIHAPVVFWESWMGPDWFAMSLFYRVPPLVEERLGSWSSQGFMMRRLELATWSSMAASLAVWLWAGGGWRPKWGPSWWPALTLLATALIMRSVYGYIALAVGLSVVVLTLAFRSRLFLVALALALPVYAALRMTEVLDTPTLVAKTKEALPRNWGTLVIRLNAEQDKFDRLSPIGTVFGRGFRVWGPDNPEPDLSYPDGLWVQLLWEGGLVGIAIYHLAVHLLPAVLAVARPRGRPRRDQIGSPAWGLAIFSLLEMFDGIHNSSPMYPLALVAGALVGRFLDGSRPQSFKREATGDASRSGAPRPTPTASQSPMPASVPTVAALACGLYVFGHGPVEGFESVKLFGGLGAALLFASAGGLAVWAAPRFSAAKLVAYGALFGAFGVSFNLAMHPKVRPVAAADIFQGLALATVVVALWRRKFGGGALGDSALAVLPLFVHVVVGEELPSFPGSQYLYGGTADQGAHFPLLPWLSLTALGARASSETTPVNTVSALAFGGAAASVWGGLGGTEAPVKFPMNLTYALLSCAAAALAFALARIINSWHPGRTWARWLASRWVAFFYLHFVIAAALEIVHVRSPWAVWPLMASLGLAATWALGAVAAPLAERFRRPGPWLVPAGLILAAALAPGARPEAVGGLALLGGLVFAAYWKELVYVAARIGFGETSGKSRTAGLEASGVDDARVAGKLLRLAVLLALLALPELIGRLESLVTTEFATPISPANEKETPGP